MLTNNLEQLKKASREGYAIPAINTQGGNYDIIWAICKAAEELHSPVILAHYVSTGAFSGNDWFVNVAKWCANKVSVPVSIHLDHGDGFPICMEALRLGFTSVMIDGSTKPIEENAALTQSVVNVARCFGVPVEAEIGELQRLDNGVVQENKNVADPEQMAAYHVPYASLLSRLKMLVNQNEVYSINEGARSLPVIIGERHVDSRKLLEYTVRNSDGVEIPLSYLVRETRGEDFKRLYSGNGGDYYPVRIVADDRKVEEIVDFTERFVKSDARYSASFTGGYYESRAMIGELAMVLSVAVALLYFILAAQFESIMQPLVILSEIVIDVFWVFLVLWMLGESLNIMSMIGLVVMSGIIINDSILKVDTMNRLWHREGRSLIRGGHSRLRPILMTSLTTILAVVPFLSRGDMGSALQFPLSLTLIVGMVAGTLVSLFFIPLFYYLIYRRRG